MEKLLLVSSSEKSSSALSSMLHEFGIMHTDIANSGGNARRTLIAAEYDLLIINAPLSDEAGVELAVDISEDFDCGIIMLVKAENSDYIQSCVENYGIFVVPKPINKSVLYSSIKFVSASRKKILLLKEKQLLLQKKLEDDKVISRAKCHLIEVEGMSEADAHRCIEKRAMDMRCSRRQVADEILKQ